MTTPIATFEDILAAMENNPRLQTALRQHVLDQEFLQLPAIVRELQQTVAQLAELVDSYIAATNERLNLIDQRLERLEAGQARLDGDMNRLDGNMNRLDGNMNRLDGNMNRLIGSDYERKAARRAIRLAQRLLSLNNVRVIYAITTPDNNELPELLDGAVAAGRIDAQEADELENADLILAGPGQYVVAEASVTLDQNDIQRARNRADLMEKATKASTMAAVIGAHALDAAVQYAATNDVTIIILPE